MENNDNKYNTSGRQYMIIYITTLEGVAPLVCTVPQSSGLFIMCTHPSSVQLSSVQFEMISVHSGKPICAPPRLSEVSPNIAFETVPVFV